MVEIIDENTMWSKLAESGVDRRTARRLGIKFLKATETKKLGPGLKELPSIYIPYFDDTGKTIDHWRVRYLQKPPGFLGMLKKWGKYAQITGSGVEVYLPPVAGVSWSKIKTDTEIAIHITEGELKAICANKNGFPTVGLGGVYAWRSKNTGEAFLESLEEFDWYDRFVYLTFDSDLQTNSKVMKALIGLAKELVARGARVKTVWLPDLPNLEGKTGLDDFLESEGVEAYIELYGEAEEFSASLALWEMNEEVVYIKDPGIIISLDTGQQMTHTAFKEHAFANRIHTEIVVDSKGNERWVDKATAKEWLKWTLRNELRGLTYAPGQEEITEDSDYNFWTGWAVEPKKGTIQPWKKLLDYLFNGFNDERLWFEKWCAVQFQQPGVKLFSAVMFFSPHQGIGKSLTGLTLMEIFGDNSSEISQTQLHSNYNQWAAKKQFILADEITGSDWVDQRKDTDRVKNLITQKTLKVDVKFQPLFVYDDCVNWLFTTNHPNAFVLEEKDRRFFIHEVRKPALPRTFYRNYMKWLGSTGPEALLDYFLHMNLSGFDPHDPAPDTPAKRAMIAHSRSDLVEWVATLKEMPNEVLKSLPSPQNKCDLWSPSQLLSIYDPEQRTRVTATGMGKELHRAGFWLVGNTGFVHTVLGTRRLYAIRNPDKWAHTEAVKASEHYNKHFGPKQRKF